MRSQTIICTLLICLLMPVAGAAQGLPQRTLPPVPPTNGTEDDTQQQMARDLAKKANQEREAALKRDTDKLVKLAGELKDYVDKSNENVMSLDVIKKADQIEKLAHSVKEKMKGPS